MITAGVSVYLSIFVRLTLTDIVALVNADANVYLINATVVKFTFIPVARIALCMVSSAILNDRERFVRVDARELLDFCQ